MLRAIAGLLCAIAGLSAAPAAADEMLPVPVVTIYPGNRISPEMLVDQAFANGTSDRGLYILDAASAVGKVARRTLLPGRVIATNSIAEPDLVNRGVVTRAVFDASGISIVTQVLPLQSGALGAFIQARNIDSGLVISGTVQADGTLRVAAK
jgi:flagella basal body P-ring formation protein FlgA